MVPIVSPQTQNPWIPLDDGGYLGLRLTVTSGPGLESGPFLIRGKSKVRNFLVGLNPSDPEPLPLWDYGPDSKPVAPPLPSTGVSLHGT